MRSEQSKLRRKEAFKRWVEKNRDKVNAYNRKRYSENPKAREVQKIASRRWTLRNRERCNERIAKWMRLNRPRLYNPNTPDGIARRNRENSRKRGYTAVIKSDVLTHYGKGTLQCCWTDCNVNDVDMLSLDHIQNNGAEHRRQLGGYSKACRLYRHLQREGYPQGYQTLCYNHQMKKEIVRKRSLCQPN